MTDTLTSTPSTETAVPAMTLTGGRWRLPLLVTLTSGLHHGAGTAGNTALLRRQDIILPTGELARVPFVSGSSLRHQLRAALAWRLVHILDIDQGSLSKPEVDLLWSGGAITRTGAQVDLDRLRRVDELLPQLTLLGYAAGSDMVAGTLTVNHLHLVCAENAWRLPPEVAELPHAQRRAGAYQGEELGTRHDVASRPEGRLADASSDPGQPTSEGGTQMIFDTQIIKPGALLAGSLELSPAATREHEMLVAVAVDLIAPMVGGRRELRLAAKTAAGYGHAILDVDLREGMVRQARDWWHGHLRERGDEILELLRELVA